MLTLFLRAMILYIVMILVMRGMGRRQLGQFQPYEFAMTILLADIISTPMESVSTPLIQGLLPVAAMFVVHCAISLISVKSDKARAIISGKPSLIISKGVIDQRELKKLCLSLSDLLEGLRSGGVLNPAEVGTAVIETNGNISVFTRSSNRPVTTGEMRIDAGYEGMPMILVMDGRVQPYNLSRCQKDQAWLDGLLSQAGLNIPGTYFAYLDTQGRLYVQGMQAGLTEIQAMPPEEVCW